MRATSGFFSIILVSVFLAGAVPTANAGFGAPSVAISDVVARVQPSVVRIVVARPPTKPDDTNTKMARASDSDAVSAIGSGFAVGAGLVATNRHVVENAISIFVATQTGDRYRAEVVGMAEKADIALLRIDRQVQLPALTFGDSDSLRAGDTVIAIGSPFGFDNTVTAGIVSSLNRDIMESPFDGYIQTDAAINHGNSGGPLFNMAGEVVGMNSVLFAPGAGSVGVGFAIPSSELKFALERLEKFGSLRAGMLPVWTQEVNTMLASAIGVPRAGGAIIVGVGPNTDRLIQLGDVITGFNNDPVTDPRDLSRKAARIPVGSMVAVELYRDGKAMSVSVPIVPLEGTMAAPMANTFHPKALGLQFASVEASASGQGVVLAGVDPTGSAADSGLRKGDIVLRVQQQSVATPDQAARALQSRIAAKETYAALLVKRDNKQSWMAIGLPESLQAK